MGKAKDYDANEILMEAAQGCALFRLRRVTRMMTQEFDREFRDTGLRSTQFAVLVGLALSGPVNQQDFSQFMGMDQSTLSRNLALLLEDGYAQSAAGSDKRFRDISLTEKGRKILEEAAPIWKKTHDAMKSGFSKEEWDMILKSLNLLNRAFK